MQNASTSSTSAYQRISIASQFVIYDEDREFQMPPERTALAFTEETNPAIPAKHDDYVFRRDVLRDVLAFLQKPNGDALYLSGPTGSGKTSVITETAARLNWPVQQVTCNGRMEFSHLKGQFVISSARPGEAPQMRFQYGPLALAMRFGQILLLNEVDLMDPAELAGLNDVLEGRPLVIAENGGEIIKPHPMFRCVVTGNSFGSGDMSGMYQGIQQQNIAALDRYRFLTVGYSSPAVEKAILAKKAPLITEEIRNAMIQLANEVRKAFMGEDGEGGTLALTMSTRTLVRWAMLAQDFRSDPRKLSGALDRALLYRAEKTDRDAVNMMATTIFGPTWSKAN